MMKRGRGLYPSCVSAPCCGEILQSTVRSLVPKASSNREIFDSDNRMTNVELACETLESLHVFDVNERVGIHCGFEWPYSDELHTMVLGIMHRIMSRVESGREGIEFSVRQVGADDADTYRFVAALRYVRGRTGVPEDDPSRRFGATAEFEGVSRRPDPATHNRRLHEICRSILSASGLERAVIWNESSGAYDVVRAEDQEYEVYGAVETGIAIADCHSFSEAESFQAKVLSQVADSRLRITLDIGMAPAEYVWFRGEYQTILHPCRISFYGQLHDWVRPFAPLDELPPDAPAEVPIYQKWDGNLKNFEIGRILRTPEGLRLLVTTNKSSARNLRTRLKKATGLDFEAIEPEGA